MRIGGSGASLMVWHESTASGLTSIAAVLSLVTLSGSTVMSSGSIFRSTFAFESLVEDDWVTMGCVTARFELTVTGAISRSESEWMVVPSLPTLMVHGLGMLTPPPPLLILERLPARVRSSGSRRSGGPRRSWPMYRYRRGATRYR